MNTMKKSSIMIRIVAILSVVMIFTMCFIGGTFAKYTSNASNADTATVAKWSFKVGETDIAANNTFTFDLFKTIKDSNGTDNESDMSPVDGTIIAPGTQGSFDLVLKNESQVTAKYAIDYTVTNDNNIPVKFSVDNGATWTDDLADVTASEDTTLAVGSDEKTITIKWKWDFEGTDTDDTDLGAAGTATLTVTANVTATQVD